MSKTSKNGGLINNDNQPQQQPFDVVMNEHFGKYQSKGFSKNWFIPIVKEQSLVDEIISIHTNSKDSWDVNYGLGKNFPKNILLEVNSDDDGNLTSIYVLYSKGGKLYRVVSQKDYGVIKSRMELKNKKYVPYGKCDLVPFDGIVDEYDGGDLVKSFSYKNGKKNGKCETFYNYGYSEITNYKNGKKNGEYINSKHNVRGEYLDNKKIGEWMIKPSEFENEIGKHYSMKYSLDELGVNIDKFIREHFTTIYTYSHSNSVKVNYVNNILNGEFEYDEWSGNFKYGLLDGNIIMNKRVGYGNVFMEVFNYKDGIKVGTSVHYELEEGKESFVFTSYEDGVEKKRIEVVDESHSLPSKLTDITKQYLNEDLFYDIIKSGLGKKTVNGELHLEDFLNHWKVSQVQTFKIVDGKKTTCEEWIWISKQVLEYGMGEYSDFCTRSFEYEKYLIDECGYPYYNKNEYGDGTYDYDIKLPNQYGGNTSYYVDEELKPQIYTIFIKGNEKETQLLINNELLVDEKVDGKVNPILVNYTKELLTPFSKTLSSLYEENMRLLELEDKREEEKKQKEREENGLTLDSFPID